MARPKSNIERKALSTTIKVDILERLKEVSETEGIAINRLIEISLEEHLNKVSINVK